MIIFLLVIIIILLFFIVHRMKDNNSSPIVSLPHDYDEYAVEFREDDERNKSKPHEYVKVGDRSMTREDAVVEAAKMKVS